MFVRTCYTCTWLCSVHTHCEAMVQLACTIIGLISLDTYLGDCAAVLVLQCCLATCTPDALWHTTAYVMTYCGSPTVVTSFTISVCSLVPIPAPKSGRRVWCSERQLLSHGAGPYFVKNVIIVFLYPELEFLTPQSVWTTT